MFHYLFRHLATQLTEGLEPTCYIRVLYMCVYIYVHVVLHIQVSITWFLSWDPAKDLQVPLGCAHSRLWTHCGEKRSPMHHHARAMLKD